MARSVCVCVCVCVYVCVKHMYILGEHSRLDKTRCVSTLLGLSCLLFI